MSEARTILQISELSVTAPNASVPELDRFSLTLEAGQSVVLLGQAGSGKEALIRILGGFAQKSDVISGTLRFGDGEAQPAARRARTPIRIAYLPSPMTRPFAPHANVLAQLSRILARKQNAPIASAREELRLALGRLEGAPELSELDRKPGAIDPITLGLGLLACVSAQTPDLVLADHTLADLGPGAVRMLLEMLAAEQKRLGFALLYATGGLQPAIRLGGRVVVIRDGRVVEEGDAARLTSGHAHSLYAHAVQGAAAARYRSGAGGPCRARRALAAGSRAGFSSADGGSVARRLDLRAALGRIACPDRRGRLGPPRPGARACWDSSARRAAAWCSTPSISTSCRRP